MGYKSLYIWVEGEDDERFFEKIMKPKLQKKYNFIETIRYAKLKKEKIDNFLKRKFPKPSKTLSVSLKNVI